MIMVELRFLAMKFLLMQEMIFKVVSTMLLVMMGCLQIMHFQLPRTEWFQVKFIECRQDQEI